MIPESVWYHPKANHIGICTEWIFYSEYEVNGGTYSYQVIRDDNFLTYLGWVKIGML